jgi:hypothetical protein
LTSGPYAKQHEASVRYTIGWIENRIINITKGIQKSISKRHVEDLTVDSSSDEEEPPVMRITKKEDNPVHGSQVSV